MAANRPNAASSVRGVSFANMGEASLTTFHSNATAVADRAAHLAKMVDRPGLPAPLPGTHIAVRSTSQWRSSFAAGKTPPNKDAVGGGAASPSSQLSTSAITDASNILSMRAQTPTITTTSQRVETSPSSERVFTSSSGKKNHHEATSRSIAGTITQFLAEADVLGCSSRPPARAVAEGDTHPSGKRALGTDDPLADRHRSSLAGVAGGRTTSTGRLPRLTFPELQNASVASRREAQNVALDRAFYYRLERGVQEAVTATALDPTAPKSSLVAACQVLLGSVYQKALNDRRSAAQIVKLAKKKRFSPMLNDITRLHEAESASDNERGDEEDDADELELITQPQSLTYCALRDRSRLMAERRLRVAAACCVLDALIAAQAVPPLLAVVRLELMNALYIGHEADCVSLIAQREDIERRKAKAMQSLAAVGQHKEGGAPPPIAIGSGLSVARANTSSSYSGPKNQKDEVNGIGRRADTGGSGAPVAPLSGLEAFVADARVGSAPGHSGVTSASLALGSVPALSLDGYFDLPLQADEYVKAAERLKNVEDNEKDKRSTALSVQLSLREVLKWQRYTKRLVFGAWKRLTKQLSASSMAAKSLAVLLKGTDSALRSKYFFRWSAFRALRKGGGSPQAAGAGISSSNLLQASAMASSAGSVLGVGGPGSDPLTAEYLKQLHEATLQLQMAVDRIMSEGIIPHSSNVHTMITRELRESNEVTSKVAAHLRTLEEQPAAAALMTSSANAVPRSRPGSPGSAANAANRQRGGPDAAAPSSITPPGMSPRAIIGGGNPNKATSRIVTGTLEDMLPAFHRKDVGDVVLMWCRCILRYSKFSSLGIQAVSFDLSFLDGRLITVLVSTVFPNSGCDYIMEVEPAIKRCEKIAAAIVDLNGKFTHLISGLQLAEGTAVIYAVIAWLFSEWVCVLHNDIEDADSTVVSSGVASSALIDSNGRAMEGPSITDSTPLQCSMVMFIEDLGLPFKGLRRTLRDLSDRVQLWSQTRMLQLRLAEGAAGGGAGGGSVAGSGANAADMNALTHVEPVWFGPADRLRVPDVKGECNKVGAILRTHYAQIKRIFDFYRSLNDGNGKGSGGGPENNGGNINESFSLAAANNDANMTLDFAEFLRLLQDTNVVASEAQLRSKTQSNAGVTVVMSKQTVCSIVADVACRHYLQANGAEALNAILFAAPPTTSHQSSSHGATTGGALRNATSPAPAPSLQPLTGGGAGAKGGSGTGHHSNARSESPGAEDGVPASPVLPKGGGGHGHSTSGKFSHNSANTSFSTQLNNQQQPSTTTIPRELLGTVETAKRLCALITITKPVFVELLVRLVAHNCAESMAAASPGAVARSLDEFLRAQVFPRAMSSARSDFKRMCCDRKIQDVLAFPATSKMLSKIYRSFSLLDARGKPSMNQTAFVNMVMDLQLLDRSMKRHDIASIFADVQDEGGADEEGENMTLSEFQEAIIALALFKFPHPLQSPHTKVTKFLETVFFPVVRSHLALRK